MIAREVDFPPVWLAGFAVIGFMAGRVAPWYFRFSPEVGAVLVLAAVVILVVAALQLLWARTPVIPRREPTQLVTWGLFRFSRNPIYLADAILLSGLYVFFGALYALPLVPLFMLLIYFRFIKSEEAQIARIFGPEFEDYKNSTRRWI